MTHHKSIVEQPETENGSTSSELMARLRPPTQETCHQEKTARRRGRVNGPTAKRGSKSLQVHILKTSSLTTVVLLLVLVVVFGRLDCVLCKPNNQQQQQQQLTDKQLLRKAFESGGESSRANPNVNEQTSSRTNQNNNGDQNSPTASTPQTFACPEQFGYYTDTKDCTKYYVCVFGEVLHESCTGGLRFSRELQTCDWPRNVDCPQGTSAAAAESSTSATPTSSTSPTPTTTTSSTTTSTSSSSTTTASSPTSTSTTTASAATTTTMKSVGGGVGGGNSQITAFADEANDPQQPSFDEAISPVITADGAIHLHDGQGGTFGLAPNHNRALAGSSPQSADSPADAANLHSSQMSRGGGGQNVDVFVMPLQLAHAHANNNRAHQARSSQQVSNKRQQLSSTQSQTARQQQNQKVLQAATLPPARSLAPNFRESSGELNDESGDFNLASNGANDDSSANGDSSSADSTTADAAGQPQLGGGGGDSLGAQADSADNEQPDGGSLSLLNSPGAELPDSSAPSSDDSTSDSANADPADDSSNDNSGAYVPPVAGPPPLSSTTTAASRQPSSQLLSINNRQIVDPTRQTFKPIPSPASSAGQLISSSQPQTRPAMQSTNQQRAQQQQMANTNNSNRQMNRDQQQQLQAQAARQSRAGANSFPAPVAQLAPPTQQLRPARPPPTTPARQFFVPPNNNNNQQLVSSNVNFNEPPTPPTQLKPRLQAASQPVSRQQQQQQLPVSTFTQRFPSAPQQQQQQQQVTSSQRSQNAQLFSQQPRPQQFSAQFNGPALIPFEEVQPFANSSSADELPQIFQQPPAMANFAPPAAQQQQQQQRRSRPPKRHQIPNSATVATTSMSTASVVSSSSRRPPLQQQDFDPTTTTTTTSTMSTPRNQFTSGEQLDDGTDEQHSRNARPATTSSQFAPTPDFLAPTPPTRQRTSSAATTLATPTSSSTQRQRLLRPTTPIAPLSTGPTAVTTPTTPLEPPAEPAGAPGTSGGGDPQTVASRYLNSAIDALEAGQPFGTVDYDFDILSDNSTERRGGGERGANLTIADDGGGRQVNSLLDATATSSEAPPPTRPTPVVPTLSRPRGPTRAEAAQAARDQQAAVAAAAAPPTKKPRPTNKKIVVNHEQALANNRASTEPARRPEALYATPAALASASKCDARSCRLPDCKCGDTLVPGGLESKQIPQVVLLTFDDAVNDLNWEIYEELFSGRVNPNGCPVLATFYVSHEWTDYGQVQTLYSRGHEMASHSVTHSFGEKFSKSQWFKEINGQREILNMYGGVKMNDVRGMRAPFLQIGGNKMFEMLYDANFTYDSSMPIFENSPPLWPYTLDYQLAHECMITPCPTKSFPGVWEVGMTMWVDLRGGRCSMGDACSNPTDEDGVYEMLMKNFNRHYKSNRAPFGLFYHSAWFNTVHHRRGFLRFMATVNALPEVFFVTNWQMLQWMRQPTPLSEINSFEPWQCPAKNDRPPPCYHPAVCNVKSEHGTRFMKTCQPCPANQQYPWVGATGFNKSNNNKPSGSG